MIKNPIIPGFHPDASALRVGSDYYIATSTFEWWPGVEIYHSRNLVNWQLVSQPLQSESQASLWGNYNSGSIWAPHLSYSEGLFWLLYTDVKSATAFKDTLNYVITSPNITGPWSEPQFVTASGFDPSLFHDTDGRHYFLNMLFDWRPDMPNFAGTVIQEFDIKTKRLVGERKHFYKGTALGVCEAPQILKKDGFYYLLCAAGGTGYHHAATVARSTSLMGPYEESPFFPLLTAKDDENNPLQKSGHACFLSIGDEWYITQLCARPLTVRGNCTLGRETALQKIVWENKWPRLAQGGSHPEMLIATPKGYEAIVQKTDYSECVDFTQGIPRSFKTLRGPLICGEDYSFSKLGLRIFGGQSLSSLHKQSLFARRWQSFSFSAETNVRFAPKSFQQTAGLILFYDTENWMYAYIGFCEQRQCRILQVLTADGRDFQYSGEKVALCATSDIRLRVEVEKDKAQFFYAQAGEAFSPLGEVLPADRLSDDYIEYRRSRCAFSGAMVGICCQDMDNHTAAADFAYFNYTENTPCDKQTQKE